eukprot:11950494-Heterocapsa_arctica.AAC.1
MIHSRKRDAFRSNHWLRPRSQMGPTTRPRSAMAREASPAPPHTSRHRNALPADAQDGTLK